MAFKSPFLPERFLQKRLTAAAGLAVGPVIRAHNRFHPAFPHGGPESRQIRFFHIFRRRPRVKTVPLFLRSRVNRKMLGAGGRFQIFAVPLEPLNKGHAQTGCQIRVLSVRLMSPSPAGIAENIEIRRPERQPFIDIRVAGGGLGVVFGAGLRGDHPGNLSQQFLVKHRRQRNRLGENGRRAGAGHPVKSLVPPGIARNAQPRNRRRVVAELGSHFLHAHLVSQFLRLPAEIVFSFHKTLRSVLKRCSKTAPRSRFVSDYPLHGQNNQDTGNNQRHGQYDHAGRSAFPVTGGPG